MKVRFLGTHNIESSSTGCASILIDDTLAVDAGALTSHLSFDEQGKLKALLLTHQHYDHVRDVPALGMSLTLMQKTLTIYTTRPVYETLTAHLLNKVLYPDYFSFPPDKPTFRWVEMEAGKTQPVNGYEALAVNMNHSVPTVGYRITAPDGKQVFITSDTGPGLAEVFSQINPQLLIIELTMLNKWETAALEHGHLSSALLRKELEAFKSAKGYLPQVAVTHMNPLDEKEIQAEIREVEKGLGTKIRFAKEGMTVSI